MSGFIPTPPPEGEDVFDRFGRMKRNGPGWQYEGPGQVYSATASRPPVRTKPREDPTPNRKSPGQRTGSQSGGAGWAGNLTGSDRDAAAALIQLFRSYGLETLAPKIVDFVKKGYGADTIALMLQETPEWKQRFAANDSRRKAGMPVLSPAEYLAVERSYRQVLQQYGLPKGFYDSYNDFQKFIANDMSATELQSRVQVAAQWANNQDSATKEALRRMYGLGQGELAAYALDSNRALPLLERQAKAVSVAAEAQRQGLDYSRERSEFLADLGITGDQARSGYGQIAGSLATLSGLGKIYGESYNQRTAEEEIFENKGTASQKRKTLESREREAFGGQSKGAVGTTSGSSY